MTADWFPFLGVAFGSAATLAGVYFNNRANERRLRMQLDTEHEREQSRTKRAKMEELYVLVTKWNNALFSDYMNLALSMRGDITYNDYLDKAIELGKETASHFDFARIEMLIDIYAPPLRSDYDAVIDLRSRVNDIKIKYRRYYETQPLGGHTFLQEFTTLQIDLEEGCDAFRRKVGEFALGL